jgi:hypothetical protein
MRWKKISEEKRAGEIPIELIEDLDVPKLINYTLLKTLNTAMDNWEKLPYAVNVLESVVWERLPKDYEEMRNAIITTANKIFPAWQTNEKQAIERQLFIANEKLKIITREIMKKGKRVYSDIHLNLDQ